VAAGHEVVGMTRNAEALPELRGHDEGSHRPRSLRTVGQMVGQPDRMLEGAPVARALEALIADDRFPPPTGGDASGQAR
jgi:hypothetical protein